MFIPVLHAQPEKKEPLGSIQPLGKLALDSAPH
jgi:hypothetical protein